MRTLKITWTHMRRTPYQSLAAILTLFLTFLLAGAVLVASVSSIVILHYFESKPQITVFFKDVATKDDADALKKMLEDTTFVSSIAYVTKDDALAIYKEQNKNDPLLLEMVTADVLPASLEVSPIDPKYLPELESVIKKVDTVEEVVYQKDVVDTLLAWTNAIRIGGGGLVILLAIDSVLIVMTIIGMKIALKKDEVEVLKLIGAAPWYIKSPFVLEGGLYGVIGAFNAWVIIVGLIVWVGPMLTAFLGSIPDIAQFLTFPPTVPALMGYGVFLGVLLVFGFLLGSIGSLVALGRFLRF